MLPLFLLPNKAVLGNSGPLRHSGSPQLPLGQSVKGSRPGGPNHGGDAHCPPKAPSSRSRYEEMLELPDGVGWGLVTHKTGGVPTGTHVQ